MTQTKFDIVIIGSGLGGLMCGNFLTKEGFRVLILEKNRQLGGNLQTFVRDKCIFDTGVHYVGGLGENQALNKIFRYLGIMDKLKIQSLDETGFDRIIFEGENKFYNYALGYDNFIKSLLIDFPKEELAIVKFVNIIQQIVSKFPMYNLQNENSDFVEDLSLFSINTSEYINSITQDIKLRAILAASNALYAGEEATSPLYMHALIMNTYINSAHRFVDGSSQLERLLTNNINSNGGKVMKYSKVTKIEVEGQKAIKVITENGKEYFGNIFISAIHPAMTLKMLDTPIIKNSYRNRILNLENTTSCFILNLVFKENTFPYKNYNIYHLKEHNAWSAIQYNSENWPHSFAFYCCAHSKSKAFADGAIVIAYMHFEETKKWANTFNTTFQEDDRGEDYNQFKKQKAEKLLDKIEKLYPDIRSQIKSYYTSTPLTYRDYLGNEDGSLYGIKKDSTSPLKSFIAPKTKISNLFLTGQNLHTHGVYGVSIAAIKTCNEILGNGNLVNKINDYSINES